MIQLLNQNRRLPHEREQLSTPTTTIAAAAAAASATATGCNRWLAGLIAKGSGVHQLLQAHRPTLGDSYLPKKA